MKVSYVYLLDEERRYVKSFGVGEITHKLYKEMINEVKRRRKADEEDLKKLNTPSKDINIDNVELR